MRSEICENIENILDRIQKICKGCGRDPDEVTLVAVSKTMPNEDILEAFSCGQIHFGENRAKELQDKMDSIAEEEICWHMVGPLQTNKIKYMVERVNWIESVPKQKTLREIEKRASRINRIIDTLIQVNISGEDQKSGCEPEDLQEILAYAQDLDHVRVNGLMGIATLVDDPEEVRGEFRRLRKLLENHSHMNKNNVQLEHLSMGMTNDMEVAIEEGSTMVRVGRAVFGERNY